LFSIYKSRVMSVLVDDKYGLLVYPSVKGVFNIGDYIQSLAAEQFLSGDLTYVDRDLLSEYRGEKLKIILNGWFAHNIDFWPPSEKLIPLLISFHLNNSIAEKLLHNKKNLDYLNSMGPVGCRDYYTKERLEEKGVDAYFSGCLTLTLGKSYINNSEKKGVLIVDPAFNLVSNDFFAKMKKMLFNVSSFNNIMASIDISFFLKRLLPAELLNGAQYISHIYSDSVTYNERFDLARHHLKLYEKARLVVTSRIHCALPCLAMKTPVLFLDTFNKQKDSRFKGLIDLLPALTLEDILEYKGDFSFENLDDLYKRKSIYSKIEELSVAMNAKVEDFLNP